MELKNCITQRRSIRRYSKLNISKEDLCEILQSAIWAPSGKNYQPWKFFLIQNKDVIFKISEQSIYQSFMQESVAMIAVFLNHKISYDDTKDKLAIGAAIENMLLTCTDKGIGACWIGEILKNRQQVNSILGISDSSLELMAIITLGYPDEMPKSSRFDLNDFLIGWK